MFGLVPLPIFFLPPLNRQYMHNFHSLFFASVCSLESFKFPIPTPRQVNETPVLLSFMISSSRAFSEVSPTLKSPSVASITLLLPPLINVLLASLYAVLIADSPGVSPEAVNSSMDLLIFSF